MGDDPGIIVLHIDDAHPSDEVLHALQILTEANKEAPVIISLLDRERFPDARAPGVEMVHGIPLERLINDRGKTEKMPTALRHVLLSPLPATVFSLQLPNLRSVFSQRFSRESREDWKRFIRMQAAAQRVMTRSSHGNLGLLRRLSRRPRLIHRRQLRRT